MTTPARDDGPRYSTPTVYNGQRYRSKLEADWARLFDVFDIPFKYEPLRLRVNGKPYVPDFLLTRSRQWVEVKGLFEPEDCRKFDDLIRQLPPRPFTSADVPDYPLITAIPDGVFYAWSRNGPSVEDWPAFLMERPRPVTLFRCVKCRGWWFADESMGWTCQCCGASDGNGHIADYRVSPLTLDEDFPDPPTGAAA